MNPRLRAFVHGLYADGVAHDATQADRLLKRRNLEPATAELLCLLVRIGGARRVVEIGTSNGFSTIWLAEALGDTGGQVTSIDTAPIDDARASLARADAALPGLAGRVDLRQADGGGYLATLTDNSVDLLFLDAERTEYRHWWPHPVRVLRPGGVLAIDNVLSHPEEVAPFLSLLTEEKDVIGATVAVGKGLHVAWRRSVLGAAPSCLSHWASNRRRCESCPTTIAGPRCSRPRPRESSKPWKLPDCRPSRSSTLAARLFPALRRSRFSISARDARRAWIRCRYVAVFASLGYMHRGDGGLPGREFFRRGALRSHHLHLVEHDGVHWSRYLRFRDALRANPALRDAYAELKRALAGEFPRDREAYITGKTDFVERVLRGERR